MAITPKKVDFSTINEVVNGGGISPEHINAPLQASAYAQELAKNQPDISEANGSGDASVEIIETNGKPQFKFKNIKGASGNIIYYTDLMMDGFEDYATNSNLQYISTIKVDYLNYERAPKAGDYIIAQAFTQPNVYGLFKINSIAKNSSQIECYYCTLITYVTGTNGANGEDGLGWHTVNSADLTANADGTFAYNNVPDANDIYSIGSLLLDETGKVYKVTNFNYLGSNVFNVILEYYMTLAGSGTSVYMYAGDIPEETSELEKANMFTAPQDRDFIDGDIIISTNGVMVTVSGGTTDTLIYVEYAGKIEPSVNAEDLPNMNYFEFGYSNNAKETVIQENGIKATYTDTEIEYEDKNGNIAYQRPSVTLKVPIVAGENVTFEKDETNKVVKINASGSGGTKIYRHDITLNEFDNDRFFVNIILLSTQETPYDTLDKVKNEVGIGKPITACGSVGGTGAPSYSLCFGEEGITMYYDIYVETTFAYSDIDVGVYDNVRIIGTLGSSSSGASSGLPTVTSADVGKFLRVNSAGEWVAESVASAEGVSF